MEQVALNRHVSPRFAAAMFMLESGAEVKSTASCKSVGQNWAAGSLPPGYFSDLFILNGFVKRDFGSVHYTGVAARFCGSADSNRLTIVAGLCV